MEDASCKDVGVDFFYNPGYRNPGYSMALKFCRECPVREQCYQYAIDNDEMNGVWGGVVFDVRYNRSILAQQRRRERERDKVMSA